MNKAHWNYENLYQLYVIERKNLQEIGDIYGVSRERVRQVMEKVGIKRGFHRNKPHGGEKKYKNLFDYIDNSHRRKQDTNALYRFIPKLKCSECGRNHRKLHIHHITYPVNSTKDIQVLCPSCHGIKHKLGVTYVKQLDIYRLYNDGTPAKELSRRYGISLPTTYLVINKVKYNLPSLHSNT